MNSRRVEKMDENGEWVETDFEQLRKGEVVRFFESNGTRVEQKGSSLFVVVERSQFVGDEGNCKISVVPYGSNGNAAPAPTQCPYWENIVVKPQGLDKLIEATGYCADCSYMRACLKVKYSSAYFDQLRNALGFDDRWN